MRGKKVPPDTHVTQVRIDDMSHLCYSPLDDIAKMLIIDVVVLLSNTTLGALFEFILAIAKRERRKN